MTLSSPSSGFTPLDEALCLARALTVLDPRTLSEAVAGERQLIELSLSGQDIRDKWIHHLTDTGGFYSMTQSDGRGRSKPRLADDETASYEIDERSYPDLGNSLVEFIDAFEHGDQGEQQALRSVFGEQLDPSVAMFLDAETLGRLTRIKDALQPGFEEQAVDDFRRWIRSVAETEPTTSLVIATPDHLVQWSQFVVRRRLEYSATGGVAAAVPAGCEMCIKVAGHVAQTESETAARVQFEKLAWYWTMSAERRPVPLLNGILVASVDAGYGAVVVQVADEWRAKADGTVKAASASHTLDAHLDKLYEAHSYAMGAALIYNWLAQRPDALDVQLRQRVANVANSTDEFVVRLRPPFSAQVLDLQDGADWAYRHEYLCQRWQDGGPDAVEAAITDAVERHLVFPRAIIPQLRELAHPAQVDS